MTTTLPIGMFDSGVGGLTVLKALRHRLPCEDILYLGDTARLPYGTKSPETVTRYAVQASGKLIERGVKLLVVACNTATSVALDALREAYPGIPVIGVVQPGAQASCRASASGSIAVIATESTIRGNAYQKAIHAIRPTANVIGKPCPLFVSLAEEGWLDGELVEGIAARYLSSLFEDGEAGIRPDCLVLGCTHFPLLAGAIRNVIGPEIAIVDSAETTSLAVEEELTARGLLRTAPGCGGTRFLTTDDVPRFVRTGSLFLGMNIAPEDVELVDL
ncbi:glutamate racemase [Desulfovibrio mangrovi]|uniref:glutamate racemase n=1 Tax=Desulfovibrio mangrovi TaxID=2976983 RepID=UPI0022465839|nr:glutamate racemase [Desulfovibrio mangrovi]UZP67087.1 glutamate racemase [Desulfovibrio mangrovi]